MPYAINLNLNVGLSALVVCLPATAHSEMLAHKNMLIHIIPLNERKQLQEKQSAAREGEQQNFLIT